MGVKINGGKAVRLILGWGLLGLALSAFIPLAGQSEKAVIVRLVGSARVQTKGAWKPLAVQSVINDDDLIETGPNAKLILMYKGIEIRLQEKTALKIQSLTNTAKPAKVQLLSGFSWANVKDPAKRGLSIESPTSVAAVRGTKFAVSADAHGTTSCVCEGTVATMPKGGKETLVSAGGSHDYDAAGKLKTKDFKKYFKKLKVDQTFSQEISKDSKLSGCKSCHRMTNLATDTQPDAKDY